MVWPKKYDSTHPTVARLNHLIECCGKNIPALCRLSDGRLGHQSIKHWRLYPSDIPADRLLPLAEMDSKLSGISLDDAIRIWEGLTTKKIPALQKLTKLEATAENDATEHNVVDFSIEELEFLLVEGRKFGVSMKVEIACKLVAGYRKRKSAR